MRPSPCLTRLRSPQPSFIPAKCLPSTRTGAGLRSPWSVGPEPSRGQSDPHRLQRQILYPRLRPLEIPMLKSRCLL